MSIVIAIIDPVLPIGGEHLDLPVIEGITFRETYIDIGPISIESRLDSDLAAIGVMAAALRAQDERADAIVVNCMDDPGVDAAREIVSIPVIGPAEASISLAGHLGASFGIVTTSDDDIPVVAELVNHLDASSQCTSIRPLGLPVSALEEDPDTTRRHYLRAALDAVRIDGAAVLIAGCTLLASYTTQIAKDLAAQGASVPVIDPLMAAIHQATTFARLGIRHSTATYVPPQRANSVATEQDSTPR